MSLPPEELTSSRSPRVELRDIVRVKYGKQAFFLLFSSVTFVCKA
jgi:hypothetical protein